MKRKPIKDTPDGSLIQLPKSTEPAYVLGSGAGHFPATVVTADHRLHMLKADTEIDVFIEPAQLVELLSAAQKFYASEGKVISLPVRVSECEAV